MTVYAKLGSNFMQVGGDCPEGWIEMQAPRPEVDDTMLFTAQEDGSWAITQAARDAANKVVEDAWRASEMAQARENRIAIAEMGDDSIPGTAKQWQDYWLALRDWKDGNPDFPDMSKRPIRPS